jgi:hypothetical protein
LAAKKTIMARLKGSKNKPKTAPETPGYLHFQNKTKTGKALGETLKDALDRVVDFKSTTSESYDSPKIDPLSDEAGQWPAPKKKFDGISRMEKQRKEFEKELREKGVAVTPNKGILAVNADKFEPMPDNWFSLSKIDKLQWLAAHPRK